MTPAALGPKETLALVLPGRRRWLLVAAQVEGASLVRSSVHHLVRFIHNLMQRRCCDPGARLPHHPPR